MRGLVSAVGNIQILPEYFPQDGTLVCPPRAMGGIPPAKMLGIHGGKHGNWLESAAEHCFEVFTYSLLTQRRSSRT